MIGGWLATTVSCVRTTYICQPPPVRDLMPEILALVGPPRLLPDSAVPSNRIVGRVLGQAGRGPIRNALVDIVSLDAHAETDSAGYFSLSAPTTDDIVLQTRAIGYLMRRDSLKRAMLAGHRIETVMADGMALGDIEGMPCTPKRRLWPLK